MITLVRVVRVRAKLVPQIKGDVILYRHIIGYTRVKPKVIVNYL